MLSALIPSFIWPTLYVAFLASIAGGVIGSYVVVLRISFITGSIAHAILGGMGFCLWLQRSQQLSVFDPIYGAIVTAIIFSIIIGVVQLKYHQRQDSIIAIIWSLGMAVGILFLSITPGSNVDILSYLMGNILWVSQSKIITLLILDIVAIFMILFLYRPLLSLCFDKDQAYLQGLPTFGLYIFLLILISIGIVLLIQVVGVFLALAILTIPPTVANLFVSRLFSMMILGTFVCLVSSISGTLVSCFFDFSTGACIVLIAAAIYSFCLLSKKSHLVKKEKSPYDSKITS